MKQLIKRIGRTLQSNHVLVRFSRKSLICGFHRIAEPDGTLLDRRVERLTPQDFEYMLRYLRSVGYSFVSLDDFIETSDRTQKAVITFDDGFRSVYTHAFPILRKYAMPFTVFLTTAMVDARQLLWLHRMYAAIDRLSCDVVQEVLRTYSIVGTEKMPLLDSLGGAIYHAPPDKLRSLANRLADSSNLTLDDEQHIAEHLYLRTPDIREMLADGMTIGAHGHEHWSFASLNEHQTSLEIGTCTDVIVQNFATRPLFYSLAYGKENLWSEHLIKQMGFKAVCTTDPGLVKQGDPPYALPRLMMGGQPLDLITAITMLHVCQSRRAHKKNLWTLPPVLKAIPMLDTIVRHGMVSVVVPTYNRCDLVIEALKSIVRQTFRPIEIVVVDDGSTDDTVDVVREWAREHEVPDQFIVRCIQQCNRGANAARNSGIRHAIGEFVAFLDSDDRWLPTKLEKQMAVMCANADVGGVYCGIRYVNLATGDLLPENPRSYPEGHLLKEMLVHDVTEGTPCWLVRKKCFEHVGLFDESLPARQDWDMFTRLAASSIIGCVSEILVEAGEHAGSRVRTNPMNEIEAYRRIFEKYSSLRRQYSLSLRLAARAAMYRRRGRVYFHQGFSKRSAFQMYLLSILVWPLAFDSYAALAGMALPKRFRQNIHIIWNHVFGKTCLAIRSH